MINAKIALKNREQFAMSLIKKDRFSMPVYCAYFEIPYKTGTEDVKRLIKNPKLVESTNPISLPLLFKRRNKYVSEHGGTYTDDVLEHFGLWHTPVNMNPFKIPEDIDEAIAYMYSNIGMRNSDISKSMGISASTVSISIITSNTESFAMKQIKSHPFAFAKLVAPISLNERAAGTSIGYGQRDVIRLTGAGETAVLETCNFFKKKPLKEYFEKFDEDQFVSIVLDHQEEKTRSMNELRKNIWNDYLDHSISGYMTKTRLAQKYCLSRQKIGYEMKAYIPSDPTEFE